MCGFLWLSTTFPIMLPFCKMWLHILLRYLVLCQEVTRRRKSSDAATHRATSTTKLWAEDVPRITSSTPPRSHGSSGSCTHCLSTSDAGMNSCHVTGVRSCAALAKFEIFVFYDIFISSYDIWRRPALRLYLACSMHVTLVQCVNAQPQQKIL